MRASWALPLLLLLLLCAGCPQEAEKTNGTGIDPQRTRNAERKQCQVRLDALAEVDSAEAETRALQALVLWLKQTRQWHVGPYRVRVRAAPDEPPMPPGQVGALSESADEQSLVLEVPYFPPDVPSVSHTFRDNGNLALLEPLVLEGEPE